MRTMWLPLVFALACSSQVALPPAATHDAGHCPPDAGVGPLGTCSFDCLNTCVSDADCASGTICARGANGCTVCGFPLPDGGVNSCSPTGLCHSSSDCCNGELCITPDNNPFTCGGPCMPPPDECDDQRPCTNGGTCTEVPPGSCSCGGMTGHACFIPCTSTSCGAAEVCGSDGHCRPQHCDEGFVCPPKATCDLTNGDAHGCVLKKCTTDAECGSGVCVNNTCHATPGQCGFPPV